MRAIARCMILPMTPRTLVFIIAAVAAASAWAQQYRWVDEKGRVHYTDTPPPPSAKSAQKKNLKANELGQQPSYELTQAMRKAPAATAAGSTERRSRRAALADRCAPAADVLCHEGEQLVRTHRLGDVADRAERLAAMVALLH